MRAVDLVVFVAGWVCIREVAVATGVVAATGAWRSAGRDIGFGFVAHGNGG